MIRKRIVICLILQKILRSKFNCFAAVTSKEKIYRINLSVNDNSSDDKDILLELLIK